MIQSFFEGQSASWDVAKKEQNRTKNRYGNIIACKQALFMCAQLRMFLMTNFPVDYRTNIVI